MNPSGRIVKNSVFMIFGQIITTALSFLLIIIIARYLGQIGLGKYSFAFALVSLFLTTADLGTGVFMLREVARDKKLAEKYLSNIFTLHIIMLLLASLATMIFTVFAGKSTEIIIIVGLAVAGFFITTLTNPFRIIFSAFQKMEYYVLVTVVERALALLLGSIVLMSGFGIIALMFMFIISYAASFILAFIITKKRFTNFKLEIKIPLWKEFIKESIPFWLTSSLTLLYFRIDTLVLSALKGYADAGLYNAGYKIVEPLSFVPFIIIGTFFPVMSQFHTTSKEMLAKLYEKTMYYLFLIAFPLCLGVSFLADRIIYLIYTAEFMNSSIALKILVWAQAILFFNYVIGYLLNSINKQKLFTYSVIISAILNIVLDLTVIPRGSYTGASIVAVTTQIINFFLLYYLCSKNGYSLKILKIIIKPALAGAVMVGTILLLKQFNLILIIFAAAVSYVSVLLITKGIGKDEFDLFKNVLKRKS